MVDLWINVARGFGAVWVAEALRPDALLCESTLLASQFPVVPVILGVSCGLITKMVLIALAGNWLHAQFPELIELIGKVVMTIILLGLAYRFVKVTTLASDSNSLQQQVRGTSYHGFWSAASVSFGTLFFSEWFDAAQLSMLRAVGGINSHSGISESLCVGMGGGIALTCKQVLGTLAAIPIQRVLSRPAVRWLLAGGCVLLAVYLLFDR